MDSKLAVIFDIDGVLVDSYVPHFESWRMAGREWGFEMTESQFVFTFGRTSRDIIAHFWPHLAGSPDEIATIDRRKESAYRAIIREQFPAMPGAIELIDELAEAGFVLAVGSSAPTENVALTIEKLARADKFAGVVSGSDVTHGKPDPQIYLLASSRIGVPPSRCLVIEDAPVGITAAKAAGMACIGLASKGHEIENLSHADHVVRSLSEISVPLVRQLIQGK